MGSTIGAARARIFELIDSHPGLTDVQRTFGLPTDNEDRQVVALAGVADSDESHAQLGGNRREETYTVTVAIKVHDPAAAGSEGRGAVDARGFALADTVRDAIASDRTLSGTVRLAVPVATRSDGVQNAEGGGAVIFTFVDINCAARIPDGA
jgi:hypothetical protein